MLLKLKATIYILLLFNISLFAQALHEKVQVKFGNSYYNAEIIDVKNGQYKIHYDGYGSNWDEWVTSDRIKSNKVSSPSSTANGTAQESNGKFHIGQKVEVWNVTWYPATVVGFGTGDYAGYVRVKYDGYNSEQYMKESNIRAPNKAANDFAAGPRNGRYTILSYGDIYNPITVGYFDLNNGKYTYYNAAKKPIGTGSYIYDAATKKVKWQNGPLKDFGESAGFEIDRDGKTHKIRLKYSTVGTNSTDS